MTTFKTRCTEYKKQVAKVAWQHARQYGLEFEEVFSESMTKALEAERAFDPKKGSLATFIVRCVTLHLANWCQEEFRRGAVDQQAAQGLGNASKFTNDTQDPEKLAIFSETLHNLSKEARTILQIIFDAPGDLINCAGGLHKPKFLRGELKRRCIGKKMSAAKYWKATAEIKEMVRESPII